MNYKLRIFALLSFALWFTSFSAQTTIKGKVFTPEYSLGQNLAPGEDYGEDVITKIIKQLSMLV